MTTSAFVGDFTVQVATYTSPSGYASVPEVISLSGLGQVNDLIDATHFGSGGNREYIPGLADGVEVTLECNYLQNNAIQERLIADVKGKYTAGFKVTVVDASPQTVFTFDAAMLGWVINPAVDDRNTITFTLKISGAITVT